ncbi:hypothetical protein JCM11251_002021 [Rhodosporidiobolus azoricus]
MLVFLLQTIQHTHPTLPPFLPSLLTLALALALALYVAVSWPRTPAIQLPTTATDAELDLPLENGQRDVEIDPPPLPPTRTTSSSSHPNHRKAFYPRLRVKKVLTAATVAGLASVAVFRWAWEGMVLTRGGGKDVGWWIERAAAVVTWATLALPLSLLSLPHPHAPNSPRSSTLHWRLTLSLFALLALSLSLTLLRLLLPPSTGLSLLPSPGTTGREGVHVTRSLVAADAVLQLVAFLLVGTTPRSGPLYLPSSTSTPSAAPKPILPLPSSSPLSYLLFSWITPLLTSSYALSKDPLTRDQPLDEDSLPVLPERERAGKVWEGVERMVKNGKGKGGKGGKGLGGEDGEERHWLDREDVPKGWNKLLWRVVKLNQGLFIWQASLSVLNAFLYYAPAFFLQQLVAFLENRDSPSLPTSPSSPSPNPERQETQWGYVYCVGLFASFVVEAVVSGQLWFISNSLLATRIRVQLNTLIFAKTLVRKDVSAVSASKSNESSGSSEESEEGGEEDEGEEEKDEGGRKAEFKSKSSITNLFSIDADRVADFAVWSFSVYDAPCELLIGTAFLYSLIGYSALIGISVAIFFLPLNNYTSKSFAVTQDKLMSTRDRRVTLMNEVLGSIRMIKFYAFEGAFEQRILKAREDELAQLRWNFWLEIFFQGIYSVSPILCILVSFWAYTSPLLMNRELTPSVAFASLAIFNELKFSINVIPDVLQSALQCLVSLRRIEAYLRLPEIEHLASLPPSSNPTDPTQPANLLVDAPLADMPPVKLEGATVTWPRATEIGGGKGEGNGEAGGEGAEEEQAKSFELQDIQVEFPRGELSLVAGRLGSGKTLLLLALLGEVDLLSGSISCPRSSPSALSLPSLDWDSYLTDDNWLAADQTAFVPQQAWLQNATVRDNITFGLPFREERYKAVVEACSLEGDLKLLEDGDQTEIGEKGINLSGGQKARVSLARAVYSRAGLLLLDDVLSAVDAHTAAHIYEKCLKGPLLEGRTVILVSHHVQLTAPGAAYVVELDNGRIKFSGSSADFLNSDSFKAFNGDDKDAADEPASPSKPSKPLPAASNSPAKAKTLPFKPLNKPFAAVVAESATTPASSTEVSSASEDESDSGSEEQDPNIDELHPPTPPSHSNGYATTPHAGAPKKPKGDAVKLAKKATAAAPPVPAQKAPRKLIEEETRAVNAVSGKVWKLYLGLLGGWAFWMAFAAIFAGAKITDVAQTWWLGKWAANEDKSYGLTYYLGVYAFLSLLAVVVDTLQWLVLYAGTIRASAKLHKMLLHAILRAPLRFFDTQALGRIQNRFAKDLEQIDGALPDHVGRSIVYGLGVLTTLLVIASTAPTFLIGFAVLSLAYYQYARLFAYSAREFRRLDSVSKSPLFSIYGEVIAGVAVVRAFGASSRFMALMLERTTRNVTFYYYLWGTNRWLSMRFSLLSAIVVALTGYVLIAAPVGKVDAALAGFTLTFSLNISNDLLFLVRRFTQLELAMVGVERVREYAEIKQEAPEIIEPRPPAHWPQGSIEVENLDIRYSPELPSVLHNLSFSVPFSTKVGIVGSTGCGKSTLASSFFRFVEAHSGRIVIDGIDISKIGLQDLRSRLTIVPQDPVILSGSLRSTLDMFNQYDDHEIFDALRRVHLIKEGERPDSVEAGANRSVFWNLDAEVAEGGTNFSTGQRQLLCLARAILRHSKILLLDEATASTDHETDELITQTIRSEFADSTLLVIAHRLRTVIDFDRILLLDKGRLIEYDSPAKLLEDPSSRFYALCRAAGKKEFAILKKMSKGKARVTHKPRKLVRRSTTSRTVKPTDGATE